MLPKIQTIANWEIQVELENHHIKCKVHQNIQEN
jgi:hypothetical protein